MARLSALLEHALLLPELQQRKVAGLLGAAVADAAARPLHWVYDMGDLNKYVRSNPDHPEFWPESKSPFYSLPTGENSCYWDQALAVMTSLRSSKGFNFENICQEFTVQFGSSSPYNMDNREEYMHLRSHGKVQGPIVGKWLHGGMIKFFANYAANKKVCGDAHVKETDGFCCSLPVVVKYAGSSDLMEKVLKVTSTQSSWPVAVRHSLVASKIIEAFVLNKEDPIETVQTEIKAEYPEIAREIEDIKRNMDVHHTQVVARFGRPCYNPGSFQGAIHAVLTSEQFDEAVRKTILAGGCNCSRAFFIGAMMGAKVGISGIPREWIEKTNNAEHVLQMAMDITE